MKGRYGKEFKDESKVANLREISPGVLVGPK